MDTSAAIARSASRRRVSTASALGAALVLGCLSTAIAAPLPDAEVLFQEGIRLLQNGKAAEACPKLAESQRLDPAPGTQFFLGTCYEAVGRTASAWYLFVDVADQSSVEARADQEKKARARAAALEPRLCRLTIVVPPALAALPGLQIERDGVVLGPAGWGTAIPVDPGTHTVRVTAPQKKGSEATATTTDPGTTTTLTLKPLEDAPAAPTGKPPGPGVRLPGISLPVTSPGAPGESVAGPSTQRIVAGVIGGIGLTGIGLGTAFGILALNKNQEWKQQTKDTCDASLRCDAEALAGIKALEGDRDRFGTISTLGLIGGGAAIAGAVLLWATARPAENRANVTLQIVPMIGERSGAALKGTF